MRCFGGELIFQKAKTSQVMNTDVIDNNYNNFIGMPELSIDQVNELINNLPALDGTWDINFNQPQEQVPVPQMEQPIAINIPQQLPVAGNVPLQNQIAALREKWARYSNCSNFSLPRNSAERKQILDELNSLSFKYTMADLSEELNDPDYLGDDTDEEEAVKAGTKQAKIHRPRGSRYPKLMFNTHPTPSSFCILCKKNYEACRLAIHQNDFKRIPQILLPYKPLNLTNVACSMCVSNAASLLRKYPKPEAILERINELALELGVSWYKDTKSGNPQKIYPQAIPTPTVQPTPVQPIQLAPVQPVQPAFVARSVGQFVSNFQDSIPAPMLLPYDSSDKFFFVNQIFISRLMQKVRLVQTVTSVDTKKFNLWEFFQSIPSNRVAQMNWIYFFLFLVKKIGKDNLSLRQFPFNYETKIKTLRITGNSYILRWAFKESELFTELFDKARFERFRILNTFEDIYEEILRGNTGLLELFLRAWEVIMPLSQDIDTYLESDPILLESVCNFWTVLNAEKPASPAKVQPQVESVPEEKQSVQEEGEVPQESSSEQEESYHVMVESSQPLDEEKDSSEEKPEPVVDNTKYFGQYPREEPEFQPPSNPDEEESDESSSEADEEEQAPVVEVEQAEESSTERSIPSEPSPEPVKPLSLRTELKRVRFTTEEDSNIKWNSLEKPTDSKPKKSNLKVSRGPAARDLKDLAENTDHNMIQKLSEKRQSPPTPRSDYVTPIKRKYTKSKEPQAKRQKANTEKEVVINEEEKPVEKEQPVPKKVKLTKEEKLKIREEKKERTRIARNARRREKRHAKEAELKRKKQEETGEQEEVPQAKKTKKLLPKETPRGYVDVNAIEDHHEHVDNDDNWDINSLPEHKRARYILPPGAKMADHRMCAREDCLHPNYAEELSYCKDCKERFHWGCHPWKKVQKNGKTIKRYPICLEVEDMESYEDRSDDEDF